MLPRAHRLRRSAEFAYVIRRGFRATSRSVVVHSWARADEEPVRVGFVVSRGVGSAVLRNRVKRRLRQLMRDRLSGITAHSSVVVRANPVAAVAGYDQLSSDLDACLDALVRRDRPSRPRR